MVLEGFVLGLVAAFTFGFADFIAAVAARKMGITRLLLITHIASVGVATPYLVFAADLDGVSLAFLPVFAAVSVLLIAILVSFYKGLQLAPVALVSPVVSAHVVLVILLSVLFMGEQIGPVQIMGMAAAVGGVMLASMTLAGGHPGNRQTMKGLRFAIAATVGGGFWVFAMGALSKEVGWFSTIYLVRVITLILLLAAQTGMRNVEWRTLSVKQALPAVLVGILQICGLAAYTIGAQVGAISITAAAFSVYPIIPIIGGLVVFRERIASRQALGLASVLAGLLVLGITT